MLTQFASSGTCELTHQDAGQLASASALPQQLVQHQAPPRPRAQLVWLQLLSWRLHVRHGCTRTDHSHEQSTPTRAG